MTEEIPEQSEIIDDNNKEITGENPEVIPKGDTTPTQEEHEKIEDEKLRFTGKNDLANPNDILYEDEF